MTKEDKAMLSSKQDTFALLTEIIKLRFAIENRKYTESDVKEEARKTLIDSGKVIGDIIKVK